MLLLYLSSLSPFDSFLISAQEMFSMFSTSQLRFSPCIYPSFPGFRGEATEGYFFSIGLSLISQFFLMQEQYLFLIIFSGLPGRLFDISDHLDPNSFIHLMSTMSSSLLQAFFLIPGSSLLMYLSLICFPVLVPNIQEISFQFFPTRLMSFWTISSQSQVQFLVWSIPRWQILRQRWRHWFQFRSGIREEMMAHCLGYSQHSLFRIRSQCSVHAFTFLVFVFLFSMISKSILFSISSIIQNNP